MRAVVVALLLALAAVSAERDEAEVKKFLEQQQKILRLLDHVQQPTIIPEEREIAKSFKPIDHLESYENKEVVEVFWKYYTRLGFLPRGEVFSVFYEKHLPQAKGLFDLLFFAKDFDTFYKTAVWAREHLNEGLFIYALTVALLQRKDTRDIALPPPYEIHPQLFVHADVIQKAYDARLRGDASTRERPYIVYANYSGYPAARDGEQLLSYFTEDVGLNAFFSHLHHQQPFWWSRANYSVARTEYPGEKFFFLLQSLLARYHLERLSHGLPDVKPVDYRRPLQEGYYPALRFHNGREAPARPEGVHPRDIDTLYVDELENYERRIRDAIDLGYAIGHDHRKYDLREEDQSNIVGNIIEGSTESINQEFYGSVYRNLISLFSHIVDPAHRYGVPTSVLEQPETQLRDPVFYRILKRVLSIFYQYKNKLRPYTKSEIGFPGVTIESIAFDKLVTYFDDYDFEITNAVSLPNAEEGSKVQFIARRKRLNHKPFFYHLKVNSDKENPAIVRVYIGPKYDAYGRQLTLEERRNHYLLLDMFHYELAAGENVIRRSSEEFPLLSEDPPSFSQLREWAAAALAGRSPQLHFRAETLLPQRLALPRGSRAGLPLSVVVVAVPVPASDRGAPHAAPYLPSFPFDRRVDELAMDVPSVHFGEALVVFRPQQEVDSTA